MCLACTARGSCVGGAGALASSLCISSKDFTLGFRVEVDLVYFSHVACQGYTSVCCVLVRLVLNRCQLPAHDVHL